jgi:hypothetical protein
MFKSILYIYIKKENIKYECYYFSIIIIKFKKATNKIIIIIFKVVIIIILHGYCYYILI